MNLKVTTAMPAVAALLISGSGDALAPTVSEFCRVPMVHALAGPALDEVQQALAEHLSRRYTVAASQTERFVAIAYRAGQEVGLDPLLVLAVISVESRFNPIAESGMGAKGLMQIIPKYHRGQLARLGGGEEAVLDPENNIVAGTRILKEYVQRMGTLQGGLQFYSGAPGDSSARYARKVFAEHRRLEAVARAAESGSV
ncbi:MAG TPA: transglycosylase SLT domain-containing protein [Burkholderiales bacterium]|nr:transglycosylase SLT domain-containing protein [Burkholderiales bacterium]